jgi:hypothetical protein
MPSDESCHCGAVSVGVDPAFGAVSDEINARKNVAREIAMVRIDACVDDSDDYPVPVANSLSGAGIQDC